MVPEFKKTEKENIEKEYEISKTLRDDDAERLRTLLGVYDLKVTRKGKIIGFVSGVLASLAAAGIVTTITYLF